MNNSYNYLLKGGYRMIKKIIAICLCLGCAFMFSVGAVSANDTDPGQTPAPVCVGPHCWVTP